MKKGNSFFFFLNGRAEDNNLKCHNLLRSIIPFQFIAPLNFLNNSSGLKKNPLKEYLTVST